MKNNNKIPNHIESNKEDRHSTKSLALVDYSSFLSLIDEINIDDDGEENGAAEIHHLLIKSLYDCIVKSKDHVARNAQLKYFHETLEPFAKEIGLFKTSKLISRDLSTSSSPSPPPPAALSNAALAIFSHILRLYPQIHRALPPPSRFLCDFDDRFIIGFGGFGTVYRVTHRLDGRVYAVKEVLVKQRKAKELAEMQNEIFIHAQINHENVVRYFNAWTEIVTGSALQTDCLPLVHHHHHHHHHHQQRNHLHGRLHSGGRGASRSKDNKVIALFIQMEYCDGNLAEWINNRNQQVYSNKQQQQLQEMCLTRKQRFVALGLFRQILRGVGHLHNIGIYHRDLKPANILLQVVDDVEIIIKLCDFGLARLSFTSSSSSSSSSFNVPSFPRHEVMDEGTSLYLAPELNSFHRHYFSSPQKTGGGGGKDSCRNAGDDRPRRLSAETTTTSSLLKGGDKADMFALGVLLLELSHPFYTRQELCSILTGRTTLPLDIPNHIRQIISQLLDWDFSKRPSCDQLLTGNWWWLDDDEEEKEEESASKLNNENKTKNGVDNEDVDYCCSIQQLKYDDLIQLLKNKDKEISQLKIKVQQLEEEIKCLKQS